MRKPLTVAVIASKGGVAKTTTAIYLAAAAAKNGDPVELIDLDRQGSATAWLNASQLPPGVKATRTKATNLTKGQIGLTIIDTNPTDQKDIDRAAAIADFVVIPSMPGALNDERALATFNYLKNKGINAAVLLVGAQNRRATTETSKIYFDETADVFDTMIPNRSAIARSAFQWPKNLYGYDIVLNDIKKAVK